MSKYTQPAPPSADEIIENAAWDIEIERDPRLPESPPWRMSQNKLNAVDCLEAWHVTLEQYLSYIKPLNADQWEGIKLVHKKAVKKAYRRCRFIPKIVLDEYIGEIEREREQTHLDFKKKKQEKRQQQKQLAKEKKQTRRQEIKEELLGRWPALAAPLMLVLALADMPYPYYTALRIVVTTTALLLFVPALLNEVSRLWKNLILLYTAIIFNPVAPLHLDREIWAGIDIVTAGLLLICILTPNHDQ